MDKMNLERIPVIPRKTIEELKPLAVEIARIMIENGLIHDEVRIDLRGFVVFSLEAGYDFTYKDDDRIFQAERALLLAACNSDQSLNSQIANSTVPQ